MREVGYSPDPMARGLAFRRSFLIGMVYDDPTAQYIVNMQYGALDNLRDSGFELVVHPCDSRSPGYIDGVRRFVQQQKLHGVMLVPLRLGRPSTAQHAGGDRLPLLAHCVGFDGRALAHGGHPRPRRRGRTGRVPALARPYRHRTDHRPQRVPLFDRAHGRLHPGTGQAGAGEITKSRIIEAGYTFESGVVNGRRSCCPARRPHRHLHRQRRNGRRRVQGRHARGHQRHGPSCRWWASTTARWPRACGPR